MEKAKKLLMKSFDWKTIDGKLKIIGINDEEFEYAKQKGIMFPYKNTIQHDECLKRLSDILKIIDPKDVAEAFLYSLSTRKLEYRSALGSYWYVKSIPFHTQTHSYRCDICHWDTYNDLPCEFEFQNEYNVLNYERYKYGGVRHAQAIYALFDLEEFIKLPKVNHKKEDEEILYKILSCVNELKPHNKAGALQKLITSKKFFKSNKNEINVIIDIFGICGILQSSKVYGYYENFMECMYRNPPELTNDYSYPVCWWKAEDGINRSRYELILGKYLSAN